MGFFDAPSSVPVSQPPERQWMAGQAHFKSQFCSLLFKTASSGKGLESCLSSLSLFLP